MTLAETINRVLEHCNREGHLWYHDNDTGIDHVYIGPSANDRVSAVSLYSVFTLCVAHVFAGGADPVGVLQDVANSTSNHPFDYRRLYRSLHGTVNAVAWIEEEDRVLILKTRRTEGDESITTRMPLCIYLMCGLNNFDFPSYMEWFEVPKLEVIRNLEIESEVHIQSIRNGMTSVTRQELIAINEQRKQGMPSEEETAS